MTFQTKRKIGHLSILATIFVISFSFYSISVHSKEIRSGREEILSTIDGKELEETAISITYRFAHGLDVHHANELPEDSKIEPDFTVTSEDSASNFVYVENDQISTINTQNKNFKINILKTFNGKVKLMNNYCGCEGFMNLAYFVGGGITTIILLIFAAGFYYSARNQKLNTL